MRSAVIALTAAFAALLPASSAFASPQAPAHPQHTVSAHLCVTGGGVVVHHVHFRLCVGGRFHGHIVI